MRYFGLEDANRLVPVLQGTFERIRPWTEQAQQAHRRLQALEAQLGDSEDRASTARLEEARSERDQIIEKIRVEIEGLEQIGVQVKASDGLVDFRAMHEGRPVFLCWRHGEAKVDHWHELSGGFSGRQQISHPSDFASSFLS